MSSGAELGAVQQILMAENEYFPRHPVSGQRGFKEELLGPSFSEYSLLGPLPQGPQQGSQWVLAS
ncbi:hypothetical protein ACTXI4_03810 [Glutamicibacter ardleyensis]|uniref:hypothetical protein n=1 Tax=Glutamicibacter ardleyensis TaxID=225894 RepID=UPI003F93F5AD